MQKYKTEWDLSHIYKSNPLKSAARDCKLLEKKYSEFARKYQENKKYLKVASALKTALGEFEAIMFTSLSSRPSRYYAYRKNLDANDVEAVAETAKLSDHRAKLSNQIKFFQLEIGQIDIKTQQKFLKDRQLAPFKYLLKDIFKNAKYRLSEKEEKIMTLKSNPAHGMWVSGFSRLRSRQTVRFRGKDIPIAEASGLLPTLSKKMRRVLHNDIMTVYKSISDFAESEINAVVANKKINDELRGHKTPYEATVLGYENELKTVKELLAVVKSNMNISQRFYKIKAKMLDEKNLFYADRTAKLGDIKTKINLSHAIKETVESFNSAGLIFGNFVKEMFEKGLVDVYPRKGKVGGAFCSSSFGLPTYILLNHVDDFRSLTTLAHEMGHAIHSRLSKEQRPFYQFYTTATAEVASTFFENLVFEAMLKKATSTKKIILLHDKISDDISTVFRQVACFNFETELHELIRREGFLSKERIAALMNKHMKSYLGPVFKLTELDGYTFVGWPHIRDFFYVYTYAFGNLISSALYERYRKDKSKINDVIKFLSAGSSDSPEGIFRSIGINPNKKFFEEGLKKISKNIDELEQLWEQSKR